MDVNVILLIVLLIPSVLYVYIVKNVPGLVETRAALLPLAYRFAQLPDEIKAKYVHEKSSYSFGWSHGKGKPM